MSKRHVTRFSLGTLLLFLLSAFIVACGSSSASTAPSPTPAPKPTTAPSPTSTVNLTVYQGTGYSIGYPQGWTLNHNNLQVQISDAAQDNLLIQTATGSSQSNSTNIQLMQSIMQSVLNILKQGSKDYKETSVPSKTTIGGTTWDQKAATMTDPKLGPIRFNILYTQNPKHPGQIFVMFYGTTQKTFDKINKEDFQPMLQSFKFQA
jgi:hypothetical protein